MRRAAIVTTLAVPAVLPPLRDAVRTQVEARLGPSSPDLVGARVRQCLERISVSRVFDIEGLWEVLTELEAESLVRNGPKERANEEPPSEVKAESPAGCGVKGLEEEAPAAIEAEPESSPLSSPPSSIVEPEHLRPPKERTEVLDSEDEGNLSSLSPASPASHAGASQPIPTVEEPREPTPAPPAPQENLSEDSNDKFPGIILITHFSTLLNALFGQRDKSAAHESLQQLSSHLRYLSSTLGPLILLLNSTTNAPSNATTSRSTPAASTAPMPPGGNPSDRPLDPTLRSIFNPVPAAHGGHGPDSLALGRRNKPAFGLTFSQFLDLHLLCTRLPRCQADAEALSAPRAVGRGPGQARHNIRYAWVIEVLLDESGYWDVVTGARTDREQRWGAVDWKEGVGVVDAFSG